MVQTAFRIVAPLALVLSLVGLLWVAPAAVAADGAAGRQAMAEAMTRMMEAMGMLGGGSGSGSSGQSATAPFGMPLPGGSPMERYGQLGQEWMGRLMPGMPWQPSTLEGVWEAAGGGLLVVQGTNFRLYAPNWGYLDGTLRIEGDRLHLFNPAAGLQQEFELALDQGRLALRDSSGQIYLYRLLVLDGGAGVGVPSR